MADETVYIDVVDDEIVLTDRVRAMVLEKHPEVADFIGLVGELLRTPDEIRRSLHDERVVLYYSFREQILNGKWIVVVVKQVERKFISTIYATDRIKSGDVVWHKPT
jgi:hypothetical protein